MTALTDSLAEGAVQTVLEAGELLTDPAAAGWASAGLQWAAPRRTANNFEGMRVSSWTCTFPPRPGN